MKFFRENSLIIFLFSLLVILIGITWQVASNDAVSAPAIVSDVILSSSSASQIEVSFDAKSALVIDEEFKNIYYAKNHAEKRPIASITKMFAAAVVWENYNLSDEVVIHQSAISRASVKDGVRIDLRSGDKFRVFDLLSVMLIDSSNEAAYALAEAWPKGGINSEEKFNLFVAEMNALAHRARLLNTSFSDPAGLVDGENNYSTAFDLAKFIKWLSRYPALFEISQRTSYQFYSLTGVRYNLYNTNKLLNGSDEIIFGKTGFTQAAGQSIVLEVNKNSKRFIIVLLDAPDRFLNAKELINKIK